MTRIVTAVWTCRSSNCGQILLDVLARKVSGVSARSGWEVDIVHGGSAD
jgi:hypothetical protein